MGNKMNENCKKEVTITIRCSVKSKEQLKEKADKNGMTLSRYLLTRINRKSYFAFPPNFKYNKENVGGCVHVTYG